MFLPYQKNIGEWNWSMFAPNSSNFSWCSLCCFDTSPNDNVSSPLRGVSSGGRITVRSQLGSFTLHRGNCGQNTGVKKKHMATKGKNGWGIQKNGNEFENNNDFNTSMTNLTKHGNSQHLEVPMNRNTSSWQNDTLIDSTWPFESFLKWHQKRLKMTAT